MAEQAPDPPAAASADPVADTLAAAVAADALADAAAAPAQPAAPTAEATPEALDAIEQVIAGAATAEADAGSDGNLDSNAIEELLKQANFEDASAVTPDSAAPDAEVFKLPSFQQVMADAQVSSIDLLRDVELNVKIELGRSRMLVEDVLKLGEGSVVELDKLAGDPVDVFVNDRLIARGEVLVLNDNFCVRVNEIVAGVKEEGL